MCGVPGVVLYGSPECRWLPILSFSATGSKQYHARGVAFAGVCCGRVGLYERFRSAFVVRDAVVRGREIIMSITAAAAAGTRPERVEHEQGLRVSETRSSAGIIARRVAANLACFELCGPLLSVFMFLIFWCCIRLFDRAQSTSSSWPDCVTLTRA